MNCSRSKIAIIAVFLSNCIFSFSYAKDLGVIGATYHIAEKDALLEIEERAGQVNWSRHINKDKVERQARAYKPDSVPAALPKADKDRTFTVDLTYTLSFDIPDGKGGILYPKGYTFNPLDYLGYQFKLIVIDGSDKEQVNWFRKSEYPGMTNTRLLITGGSAEALMKILERPVYYADGRIADRFKLAAVPSVIAQKGRVMEVKEIDVKKDRNK